MADPTEPARWPKPLETGPDGRDGRSDAPAWTDILDAIKRDHPDRLTLAEVARALSISTSGVRHHLSKLGDVQWVTVMARSFRTWDRDTVERYARTRLRIRITQCRFKGVEVERIQRICEVYYRQNQDIAPNELLALVKRVAKL